MLRVINGLVVTDEMQEKMPNPVFGCASCWEERSLFAEDLMWSEEAKEWLCVDCADSECVQVTNLRLADLQKEVGWVGPNWRSNE